MYPEDKNNNYPFKLCNYLFNEYLKKFKKDSVNFLDIGCGRGTHINNFKKLLSGNFYGIDLEESKIKDVSVFSCNLENSKLPFSDNFFDVIFSKSVLEHVNNTNNFLNETYRVLKPGGVIILMVPDWQSQMKNFYDDYTHVKPFTIKSIYSALKINDFKDIKVTYFRQLPIVWKFPIFEYFCDIISVIFPESFKWKSITSRNTKDRKWIRFSKEKMLLGVCTK